MLLRAANQRGFQDVNTYQEPVHKGIIKGPKGAETALGGKSPDCPTLVVNKQNNNNNNKSFRPTSPGVARFFCNVISVT